MNVLAALVVALVAVDSHGQTSTPTPTQTPTQTQTPTGPSGIADIDATEIIGITHTGSIIFLPKVVANATRDTLIQVTNLSNTLRSARCFYIRAETFCDLEGCTISLSSTEFPLTLRVQQTLSWVASRGQPPDPLAALADLVPPVDADFDGALVCIEADVSGAVIPGNALSAQATLTHLDGSRVAKYTGFPLRGFDTNNADNDLCLGGSVIPLCPTGPEYESCPAAWKLDHRAAGDADVAFSDLTVNTLLRAVPCALGLIDPEAQDFSLFFSVVNEFEQEFSGNLTTPGFTDLSLASISSVFTPATLGSPFAQTRFQSQGEGFILLAEEVYSDDGVGASTMVTPYVEGVGSIGDQISLPDLNPPNNRLTNFNVGDQPRAIVSGPDGNLWFTDGGANSIGRLTTAGAITVFTIPTSGSGPLGITAGGDGNLWFTEFNGNKIGRITTAGVITEFSIPSASSQPVGITAGSDGNVWFVESVAGANKIGRITPAGVITEFPIANVGARWITRGRDGNLWLTEALANKIGRMTTSGVLTEFGGLTSNAFLSAPNVSDGHITAAHDGKLWFTEGQAGKLGSITVGGIVEEITPSALEGEAPLAVAAASDGDVWFTTDGFSLGSAGTLGFGAIGPVALTERPHDLTTGPDGNLWIVEFREEQSSGVERYIVGIPR